MEQTLRQYIQARGGRWSLRGRNALEKLVLLENAVELDTLSGKDLKTANILLTAPHREATAEARSINNYSNGRHKDYSGIILLTVVDICDWLNEAQIIEEVKSDCCGANLSEGGRCEKCQENAEEDPYTDYINQEVKALNGK